MIQSTQVQLHRNFYLILICAMLGACATTQKSSTGSGDQTAAPISDAGQAQDAGTPGQSSSSSSPGANGASSKSNPARTPGAASTSSANTGAKQGSSEGTPAISDNDDAAQLKRQRAEQEAQINRLRNDQQAAAEREEADAARARDEQAAAEVEETARRTAAASEGRPITQDDEMAVFPGNGNAVEPGSADNGALAVARTVERSVYFDYNEARVSDEYDAMLMANAAYLKAHPALVTEVQGNCDERGSREYNLALGARRAESVKRALELAGADGSRINAISYGSEKPIASGKDEESYSQNRRADIIY